MKIQVRYFASVRETLNAAQEVVELPVGATLAELRERLIARDATHAQALGRGRALRVALDQRMAHDESAPLSEGSEVAFFPPVTGG